MYLKCHALSKLVFIQCLCTQMQHNVIQITASTHWNAVCLWTNNNREVRIPYA